MRYQQFNIGGNIIANVKAIDSTFVDLDNSGSIQVYKYTFDVKYIDIPGSDNIDTFWLYRDMSGNWLSMLDNLELCKDLRYEIGKQENSNNFKSFIASYP